MNANILTTEAEIKAVVGSSKRIAILGIKTEAQAGQPAFYVAEYLAQSGIEIVPVPVYYPDAKEILGQKVFRTISEIPGDVDMVNVFRRPSDIDAHVDDIIRKKPRVVWFQLGIRNDAAAQKLAEAGIKVVQDRCLMVDHRQYAR